MPTRSGSKFLKDFDAEPSPKASPKAPKTVTATNPSNKHQPKITSNTLASNENAPEGSWTWKVYRLGPNNLNPHSFPQDAATVAVVMHDAINGYEQKRSSEAEDGNFAPFEDHHELYLTRLGILFVGVIHDLEQRQHVEGPHDDGTSLPNNKPLMGEAQRMVEQGLAAPLAVDLVPGVASRRRAGTRTLSSSTSPPAFKQFVDLMAKWKRLRPQDDGLDEDAPPEDQLFYRLQKVKVAEQVHYGLRQSSTLPR
ncbi:hypothetical protein FALBO_13226 [Fusarium albosuccineum]|uniref:Uncharacterized protein n=1 Tax=Fusarium albosuccineum TaxID=1237068 RepID=A0A8H4P7A8_9HYPO|nr:hypothetical protein FALBO_13226 [Fusarium albosuccineum]